MTKMSYNEAIISHQCYRKIFTLSSVSILNNAEERVEKTSRCYPNINLRNNEPTETVQG